MNRSEEWADYLDPAEPDPGLPPAHREMLDRFTAALADEAVWSEPPATLRSRLLDLASAEQPASSTDTPATPPQPSDGGTGDVLRFDTTRRSSKRGWWVAVGATAAAAALVVTLAWPRPQVTTFAMQGTALAPRARAVAELEPRSAGLAITLEVKGLAAAPPGTYYCAWLRGPDGVVPVGTFHWRKGGIPIELWSGVLTDRYPELFVTLQREGAPPTPSSEIVLTGRASGDGR